jgi:hypothetical protein
MECALQSCDNIYKVAGGYCRFGVSGDELHGVTDQNPIILAAMRRYSEGHVFSNTLFCWKPFYMSACSFIITSGSHMKENRHLYYSSRLCTSQQANQITCLKLVKH